MSGGTKRLCVSLVWVDYLSIVGPRSFIDQVRHAFNKTFEAVDLGKPNRFLDMEIWLDGA
jgi:hypothetical protein